MAGDMQIPPPRLVEATHRDLKLSLGADIYVLDLVSAQSQNVAENQTF
jgi:hypothetical protein